MLALLDVCTFLGVPHRRVPASPCYNRPFRDHFFHEARFDETGFGERGRESA